MTDKHYMTDLFEALGLNNTTDIFELFECERPLSKTVQIQLDYLVSIMTERLNLELVDDEQIVITDNDGNYKLVIDDDGHFVLVDYSDQYQQNIDGIGRFENYWSFRALVWQGECIAIWPRCLTK